MRILVTGGLGFIGSHLMERLESEGHDLIVLDRASGKTTPAEAEVVKGDVTKKSDVDKSARGCDAVFHLASVIDVRADTPQRVNVEGSRNVFDAAREEGAKIIFTSSAAVYGDALVPVSEGAEKNPISSYGQSKLDAERMLSGDAFVVRLFNVYGPRGNSFINRVCRALEGEELKVYGDGLQTRDYVYVDDAVDALMLGLKNRGVYNVGTGVQTTVNEMIEKAEKISGSRLDPERVPAIDTEIRHSCADISMIRALGWEPKTDVDKGIRNIMSRR